MSAVAGLLVAGMLFPIVGLVGVAARDGADRFERLPNYLKEEPLPQISRILAADGSVVASLYYQDRVVVPLSAVPSSMRQAIIAIEDSRFYEHHGIDFVGLIRAVVTNGKAGTVEQGGSTITQQYVKNVLVEQAQTSSSQKAATSRSLARKLREARYALALERRLSKNQILERYLNIAYFGDGAYGVATAAQRFFSTSIQKLTLPQAALLAGLVRDPGGYDPVLHPKAALHRRDTVIERMRDLGYISPSVAAKALTTPLGLRVTPQGNGCEQSSAPFFCDWVLDQIRNDPTFGATEQDRINLLLRGGLTIRTTLDPKVQRAAQQAVDSTLPRTSTVATAVDVVQPGTGKVLAMAVNRNYGTGAGRIRLNLATGGSSGYQAGSTFKIFVLATALRDGIPLSLRLHAPPVYTSRIFTDYNNGRLGPYVVHNAGDGEACTCDVTRATWDSVNTFFVQLEERTGFHDPADLARRMGVTRFAFNPRPSFFLGAPEVSPLDMAEVYATLAAHGVSCVPMGYTGVAGADGKSLGAPKPHCTRVLDAGIADTVTSVLRGVIDGPDPFRTGKGASIGRPAAGKTGTTEQFSAAWFDGYTPQLATAVWVGNPAGGFSHPLIDVSAAGQFFSRVYGGTIPAMIWAKTMKAALTGVPAQNFTTPDKTIAAGTRISVPDVVGLTPAQAMARLQQDGLAGVVEPTRVPSAAPDGDVGVMAPAAGTSVMPGTIIRLYLSNGTLPVYTPPPTASSSPSTSPSGSPSAPPPPPSPSPSPSCVSRRHCH